MVCVLFFGRMTEWLSIFVHQAPTPGFCGSFLNHSHVVYGCWGSNMESAVESWDIPGIWVVDLGEQSFRITPIDMNWYVWKECFYNLCLTFEYFFMFLFVSQTSRSNSRDQTSCVDGRVDLLSHDISVHCGPFLRMSQGPPMTPIWFDGCRPGGAMSKMFLFNQAWLLPSSQAKWKKDRGYEW